MGSNKHSKSEHITFSNKTSISYSTTSESFKSPSNPNSPTSITLQSTDHDHRKPIYKDNVKDPRFDMLKGQIFEEKKRKRIKPHGNDGKGFDDDFKKLNAPKDKTQDGISKAHHRTSKKRTDRNASVINKAYTCDQCKLNFSNTGNLNRHIRIVHELIRIPCEYPNCMQTFSQATDRNRHRLRLHNWEEDPLSSKSKTKSANKASRSKSTVHSN